MYLSLKTSFLWYSSFNILLRDACYIRSYTSMYVYSLLLKAGTTILHLYFDSYFFFFFFNKFSRHLIRRKSVLSYLNILAVFVFKAVDKTLLFLLNYFVGLNIWNTHSILTAFHIGDSKVFLFLFLF